MDERVKTFFQQAKKQKLNERDTEYAAIRKDYYKVLDNAGNVVVRVLVLQVEVKVIRNLCSLLTLHIILNRLQTKKLTRLISYMI